MNKLVKAVGLLCVLGACVGGYFYMQKQAATETKETSEIAGRFDLTDKETQNLAGLSWTDGSAKSSFTKTEGSWVNDLENYPVNQAKLESLGDTLTALQATRQLENVSSPEDYGIKAESFKLVATWDDGSTTTYVMGDQTPFGDGYYLTLDTGSLGSTVKAETEAVTETATEAAETATEAVTEAAAEAATEAAAETATEAVTEAATEAGEETSGESAGTPAVSGIYTIEESLATLFTFNDEEFVQKTELADLSGLTRICLGDEIDLTYQSGGSTYEPEEHWVDTATGRGMDEENAQKLSDGIKNLTLGTFKTANATEEELASYGLTAESGYPVKVYQGEELILDLLLGKAPKETPVAEETASTDAALGEGQEEQSETYVRMADSNQVYALDSATYENLTSATMDTLFDRSLVGLPFELVDQAEFAIAGNKYLLEGKALEGMAETAGEALETVAEVEEAASEATTQEVQEETSQTAAEESDAEEVSPITDSTGIWDALTALKATALAQTPGGEEILSMTVTRTDGTVSNMAVQAADVDSYVVLIDEEPAKLVSASDVDALVRLIKAKLA